MKYDKRVTNVYPDDEEIKIIGEIYRYAEINTNFKTEYLDGVLRHYEDRGYITAKQYNGLVNIYYSFRIEEFLSKYDQKAL